MVKAAPTQERLAASGDTAKAVAPPKPSRLLAWHPGRVWIGGLALLFLVVLWVANLRGLAAALLTGVLLLVIVVLLRQQGQLQQAQQRAAADEERLRGIIESVDVVTWELELPCWRWTYVSPQVERVFGYPADRWLGEPSFWLDHVHPDDRHDAQQLRLDSTARGQDHTVEYRFLARDGRVVWLRDIVRVGRDAQGVPARLTGVLVDITELRQNQNRLRLAQQVFDVTSEAILLTDAGGLIVMVNPAFETFIGQTAAQAVGRPVEMLRCQRHDDAFYAGMRSTLRRVGRWGGEIWIRRHDGGDFPAWLTVAVSRDANGQRTGWVLAFSDISRVKQQEHEIWLQANHDSLTGLANRHLFLARLDQALATARRRQAVVGLLFIDLDRFKWVNDTLGHEAGDAVLVEAGRRLRHCVREADTVARIGGDEFTVVLEGLDGHESLITVVDKVQAALAAPYRVLGTDQHLSGSVGITVFPDDGDNASSLVRYADIAMYRAKASGHGQHAFYSPEMQRDMLARQHIEAALRHALAHRGFVLHYQPIVDVHTLRCRGAEALLRLADADRGLLEPGEFIAVAEDSGLISAIGAWLAEQACAQWRHWVDSGLEGLPITINAAGVQFRGPELQDALTLAMQRYRVPVDQITLDIGEAVLVDPTAGAAGRLRALQRGGVQFSIDRFGFGGVMAPLSSLQDFRIRSIKIDRAVLSRCPADEQSMQLVDALVKMAHSLGVQAVAVGVETAEQHALLRRIGCDRMQGYFSGRPVDAQAFAAHLQAAA